jgi:hypothetical protein
MSQYMMLIYTPNEGGPTPEELQAMHPHWNAYTQSLSDAGVLVAGDALEGSTPRRPCVSGVARPS